MGNTQPQKMSDLEGAVRRARRRGKRFKAARDARHPASREDVEELVEALDDAVAALESGVEIVSVDQLGRWPNVRGAIERGASALARVKESTE